MCVCVCVCVYVLLHDDKQQHITRPTGAELGQLGLGRDGNAVQRLQVLVDVPRRRLAVVDRLHRRLRERIQIKLLIVVFELTFVCLFVCLFSCFLLTYTHTDTHTNTSTSLTLHRPPRSPPQNTPGSDEDIVLWSTSGTPALHAQWKIVLNVNQTRKEKEK